MKMFTRLALTAALVTLVSPSLAAQTNGNRPFTWYFGGQGGFIMFETPRQERGAIPTLGANVLITAKRTALLLSVDEGIGDDEVTGYIDPSAVTTNGVRDVTFNDIRKYAATLLYYPLKSAAQPFLGIGAGIIQLHNPFPAGPFATPDEQENARTTARNLGSFGFASFVGGLQLQVGSLAIFGQYQITTSPGFDTRNNNNKLLTGPTHSVSGGIRFSLGSAKEGIEGGGY
jgi:hypothetical protein